MGLSLNISNQPQRWDNIGKYASLLCAIHCGICALVPGAFTLLGMDILLDHEAEWTFTIFAIVFALGALVVGWLKHRSLLIAGLFTLGITSLLASRFLEEAGGDTLGTSVGILAGVLLLVTHLNNSAASSSCEASCCDTQSASEQPTYRTF